MLYQSDMLLNGASLEQSVRIEKKYAMVDLNLLQCEGRFGQMTVYAAVLEYDDPT